MAEGLRTITSVATVGGSPTVYTVGVDDSTGMATNDHFGARSVSSSGPGGVWVITAINSGVSIDVREDLTEKKGSDFGVPVAGACWFATPSSSVLSIVPSKAGTWDAAHQRNTYLTATGTGGGMLDSDSTSESTQSSGGTGYETLKTLTLAAGTLAADGDIVEFHAGGRIHAATGAGVRYVSFKFGSALFAALTVPAVGTEIDWTMDVVVIRTGATTQTVITTASRPGLNQHLRGSASETLSSAVTCLIQARDLNSEDDCAADFFYSVSRVAT